MRRFQLSLEVVNDAFMELGEPAPGEEVGRILRTIARDVTAMRGDCAGEGKMVHDENGNIVGGWAFTDVGRLATVPAMTWAELDYLAACVEADIEAIETTDEERRELWPMANSLRTAVRESQQQIPEEHR